jgi:hypothetical protein
MASNTRTTFPRIIGLLLCSAPVLLNFARADDLTGMAQDDAKDLLPPAAQAPSGPCYNSGFLPMPSWARGVTMPPLPAVLTPMGRKAVLTTPPVPAPAPLAPPKDEDKPTVVVARPTVVTPAPAPSPNLIAVSPFLDWIRANPQAAADQARQQAGAYSAVDPSGAVVAAPTPNAAPNTTTTAPVIVAPPAPYWMPPLIDAAPIVSNPGNISGSGAAIYSTPQR